MYVDDQLVTCQGFIEQQCYLIKENESDDWEYFYDEIIGFSFEEGFEYKLRVEQCPIENPPQDASSIKTTLIEVLKKDRVAKKLLKCK